MLENGLVSYDPDIFDLENMIWTLVDIVVDGPVGIDTVAVEVRAADATLDWFPMFILDLFAALCGHADVAN